MLLYDSPKHSVPFLQTRDLVSDIDNLTSNIASEYVGIFLQKITVFLDLPIYRVNGNSAVLDKYIVRSDRGFVFGFLNLERVGLGL